MTDIVAHLRACRDRFAERAARPVVAWDCMGASRWARVCGDLADEIEGLGLTGQQAIGFLKGRAHSVRNRADAANQGGMGLIVSLDTWNRFDEIIDPIARDRTGWIEVSGHAEHFGREGADGMPEYRRMLGVNTCVAFLKREWKEERRPGSTAWCTTGRDDGRRRIWVESDAAWEARRLEWLGRYHPDVWVMHKEGGWHRPDDFDYDKAEAARYNQDETAPRAAQYTPLYGTVAQHMTEPFPLALPTAFGMLSTRAAVAKAA